jgi:hypothetical protein
MEARKGREERGVDVDHPVAPVSDEALGQKPHEAGEANELDPGLAERLVERGIEARPVGKVPMRHDFLGEVRLRRVAEAGGVGAVRQDRYNFCGKICSRARLDQ